MSSNVFYGIGEPLIQREGDTHVPAEAYLDLVKALGCGAYRSWMHLTEILKDPVTPDPEAVSAHTRLLDRAAALGLEVTGMSHEWFLPKDCRQTKGHAMPQRCRTDFADIQNKKECGGNRQWQNHYLRNWAANTKGKGII